MSSKQTTSTATDTVQEFEQWWSENENVARTMLSENDQYVLLVPGKPSKTIVGHGYVDNAIILCKWGLQNATLRYGEFGSCVTISVADAIKEFKKANPGKSFMDRIREGYNGLLR